MELRINQDGRRKVDCIYNDGYFCNKGLPGTPCDLCGCAAFYPKGEAMAKMQFYHHQQMIEMEKHLD